MILPEPGCNNIWYLDRSSDAVIIFVHGILSDSRSCWLRDQPNSYWPHLIVEDERFRSYSVFLGGYYTDVDAGPYDLSNCADELFSALHRSIDGSESILARKKLIFVCHSTGGIVVRYMLETRVPIFAKLRLGLLLIASPSYGSKWATRLGLLSRVYNQQLGIRLEWGNWSLQDLDERFRRLIAERRLPGLVGLEAYENHFIIHRRWFPDRSFVVPKASAGKYFGPPMLLRHTDHFTAVKPDSRNHPAYELLADFTTKFDIELPEALQHLEQSTSMPYQESSIQKTAAEAMQGSIGKLRGLITQKVGTFDIQITAPLDVTTMINAEEKLERRRRWTLLGIVLVLFSVTFALGYHARRMCSIDFTQEDSAAYYLAIHSRWRPIDEARGELSLRAGIKQYRYATGDATPTVAYLASEYVAAHPMPNRDVFDDYYRFKALILPTLGTKTGIWIAALSKVNQLTPTQTRLLIISGIMTGGILGVFLGTVDNGDINSPAFHQKLATDKKLWVDYEEYFRSLCSIFTKRWKPDMDAKSRAEWELSIKNINSQKASELKRCLD